MKKKLYIHPKALYIEAELNSIICYSTWDGEGDTPGSITTDDTEDEAASKRGFFGGGFDEE